MPQTSPRPFAQRASRAFPEDISPLLQPFALTALSMASFGFVLLRTLSPAATKCSYKSRVRSLLMQKSVFLDLGSFRKNMFFHGAWVKSKRSYFGGKTVFPGSGSGHHLGSHCNALRADRTIYGHGTWVQNHADILQETLEVVKKALSRIENSYSSCRKHSDAAGQRGGS